MCTHTILGPRAGSLSKTPRVREESYTKQVGRLPEILPEYKNRGPFYVLYCLFSNLSFFLWLRDDWEWKEEKEEYLCHVGLRMIFSTFNISPRRHDQFSTGMLCGSI